MAASKLSLSEEEERTKRIEDPEGPGILEESWTVSWIRQRIQD